MRATSESFIRPPENATKIDADTLSDRRADLESKQLQIASFLRETECDGLLILEPENFSWLTSGGTSRGVLDQGEMPALYFSAESRWLLSSNADSQRLFDEELDGLGFQLKEWHWHWGREQLLTELCQGRKVACDRDFSECKPVGIELGLLRRTFTGYEQACYRSLGQIVSHALEATCRTMVPNQMEREIAGHLSHRLLHRGAFPVAVGVAADGRSRPYRHFGYTKALIGRSCLLKVTARKYGLCVTACRSLSFGTPDDSFVQEQDAACKISATYAASTWPDAMPRQVLAAGRRIYQISGFEHEWLMSPQGFVTGRAPVELQLNPQTDELFQAGWAITWSASVGGTMSCDSFLITDQGPENVTPTESWPLKRIRLQGSEILRPFFLQR